MKNNWYKIFRLDEFSQIDDVVIFLEYFLSDYIFKEFDNKGNIILIDKVKYTEFMINKNYLYGPFSFDFNFKKDESTVKKEITGNFHILRSVPEADILYYVPEFLDISFFATVNSKYIYKDSDLLEIKKT